MKLQNEYQGNARLIKNELEVFLSYINENMITKIVERTNGQVRKVRKKINADGFLFRYMIQMKKKLCLFGILYFRGLYHDTKQPTKELLYDTLSSRKIYRAAMSLNRHKWLISPTIFHDHNTVRADFLEDRFACMKWFLTEFEKKKKMRGSISGI